MERCRAPPLQGPRCCQVKHDSRKHDAHSKELAVFDAALIVFFEHGGPAGGRRRSGVAMSDSHGYSEHDKKEDLESPPPMAGGCSEPERPWAGSRTCDSVPIICIPSGGITSRPGDLRRGRRGDRHSAGRSVALSGGLAIAMAQISPVIRRPAASSLGSDPRQPPLAG